MKAKLFLIFLLPIFFFFSCGNNQVSDKKEIKEAVVESVNEAQLLVEFVENTSNFINTKRAPTMITPEEVYENLGKYLVLDIRSQSLYETGHIDGAVHVKYSELYSFLKNDVAASRYPKIVLACNSGQSASYAASLLQLAGFANVYVLKWGMSSWAKQFAEKKWVKSVSEKYAKQLQTKGNAKGKKGGLPTLSTGKKQAYKILINRVQELLKVGFKKAAIKKDTVFANPEKFYTINYWPVDKYALGHIPGAVQYQPKKSLSTDKYLLTLPTNKPVVVYCFTGQHSAFVTAYLRLLGYDAYSLRYGANSFMNSTMKKGGKAWHGFDAKIHVKNYPLVAGALPSLHSTVAKSATNNAKTKSASPIRKKKKKKSEEEGGC